MSLLFAVLMSLLGWAARGEPGGPLWRTLIARPAAWLSEIRPRHLLAIALFLLLAPIMTELAMPGLAMVMAVDVAAWIEVVVAVLLVARLRPGWRTARGMAGRWLARIATPLRRAAARAWRRPARRPSRHSAPSDDDGAAGWAFA